MWPRARADERRYLTRNQAIQLRNDAPGRPAPGAGLLQREPAVYGRRAAAAGALPVRDDRVAVRRAQGRRYGGGSAEPRTVRATSLGDRWIGPRHVHGDGDRYP